MKSFFGYVHTGYNAVVTENTAVLFIGSMPIVAFVAMILSVTT